MRILFFAAVFFYSCLSLSAQPGEISRQMFFGLYDERGKGIDSANTGYLLNISNARDGQKINYTYRDKKFRFVMEHNLEAKVLITEMATGNNMTIYTTGPMDSLNFKKGEYRFDLYESFLFNIRTNGCTIINRQMENFPAGRPHRLPLYYKEELDEEDQHSETRGCYNMAREMEALHGGKNWIRNVCNDTYEEYVHSLDSTIQQRISTQENMTRSRRVEIYPYKQNMYLRHEFLMDKSYDHVFSISTDGCLTWKKFFTIKSEWYVHLMYFPGSDQLGIDITNSGVVLLNQGDLTEWKAYVVDLSEEPPTPKKEVLVFKNRGWMEDNIEKFYFSE